MSKCGFEILLLDITHKDSTVFAMYMAFCKAQNKNCSDIMSLAMRSISYWTNIDLDHCTHTEKEEGVPGRYVFLAITRDDGTKPPVVVGFCHCKESVNGAIICKAIFVEKSKRRLGVGTLLLKAVIHKYENTLEGLVLGIAPRANNKFELVHFFAKRGFEFTFERDDSTYTNKSHLFDTVLQYSWFCDVLQNKRFPMNLPTSSSSHGYTIMVWRPNTTIRALDGSLFKALY